MSYSWIETLEGNCRALESFFQEIKLQREDNEWTAIHNSQKREFGDEEFEIIKAFYSLEHGLLYCVYIEPMNKAGYYELRALCPDYLRRESLTGIEDLFLFEGEKQETIRGLFTRYRDIKRKALKESKAFTDYLIFSSLYVQ